MMQICGESSILPLKMIFEASLSGSVVPDDSKKSNIVSAHNKDLKNMLKNCLFISLLPIFAKFGIKNLLAIFLNSLKTT